jgi:hypothetical protein
MTTENYLRTIPSTYWEQKTLKQELADIEYNKFLNTKLTYGSKK